jgi:hypothetical protein
MTAHLYETIKNIFALIGACSVTATLALVIVIVIQYRNKE